MQAKAIWKAARVIGVAAGGLHGFIDTALKGQQGGMTLPGIIQQLYFQVRQGGIFAATDPIQEYFLRTTGSKSFAMSLILSVMGWGLTKLPTLGVKGFTVGNVGKVVMASGLSMLGGALVGGFLDPPAGPVQTPSFWDNPVEGISSYA